MATPFILPNVRLYQTNLKTRIISRPQDAVHLHVPLVVHRMDEGGKRIWVSIREIFN